MMLDSNALGAPLLDHRGLDLEAAQRITYLLEQRFRYDYDAPVASLRQRLVVVPKTRHGRQYRRAHLLQVSGARTLREVRKDSYGNVIAWLRAERVEATVEFRIAALIERVRDDRPATLSLDALRNPGLLNATRLTAPDDRLRALAADASAGRPVPLDRADRICDLVHSAIEYEYGPTSVRTTAAEALAGGRGVCQDFAHVMLAVCHLSGLPARYVSGHLLGQGGTHAWVEVIVRQGRQAVAVAFDPCNGRRANSTYVTVATGRDYADVAPTSGSYVGTAQGRLRTERRVGILAAA
jgi:transglutaminase-like putative cysteine protease